MKRPDDSMPPCDWLEYCDSEERFFDYCLYRYEPKVAFAGKHRSVNLLRHSFRILNAPEGVEETIATLRRVVGAGRTVWGLKKQGSQFSWEYYIYDYRRTRREASITQVLDGLQPLMRSSLKVSAAQPYFMFSIDIDEALRARELRHLHLYMGNSAANVSSGISYRVTDTETTLENIYFFFDPNSQYGPLMSKVMCSAYLDPSIITFEQVLWPELRNCKTICAANKRGHDCIYFSGVDIHQLLFFLRRLDYPQELVAFVAEHTPRLDHLQFDVGIDYRMEDGELRILKSGYYGAF